MSEPKKEKTKSEYHSSRFQGIYRSETSKVIAGVAGGLGEYFNVDPTIIRIIFILLTVFGGSGLIIYIILWLIIPSKSNTAEDSQEAIRSNIEDMKNTTRTFAHSIKNPGVLGKDNSRFWWAILIIIIGFFFLMNNYGLLDIDFEKLWPLVLIILGMAIILRKR
jgi:phage shock protein C